MLYYQFPYDYKNTLFHIAIENLNDEVFEYIMARFPDCINLVNKDLNTPFYSAVKSSNFSYINRLIAKGSDIHHIG